MARTVYGKEYALRLNCAKNGCVAALGYTHAEDGDITPIDGPGWQKIWEKGTLVGHACDRMTRTVTYSPWIEEDL